MAVYFKPFERALCRWDRGSGRRSSDRRRSGRRRSSSRR